jgi:hypothetical protein
MATFDARFHVECLRDASAHAAALFRECFGAEFPVPREGAGLPFPTPAANWRQCVAFYDWDDGRREAVGFCNWIRHGRVYLGGGMCVSPTFYRRLSREDWRTCRDRGGVAQLLLEAAFRELDDADGWFGYCGDRKAYAVDVRAGMAPTRYPFLVVKWQPEVRDADRAAIEDEVAAIGPF